MSRVFIELYLDEDVNLLIASLVRARGFIATTARDEGQLGRTDAEQLEFAAARRMTMLTHNRVDFEGLVRQYHDSGASHGGIILAVRRSPYMTSRGDSWRS